METPTFQPSWSNLLMKALWGFLMAAWQEENLYRGYLRPLLHRADPRLAASA